MVQPIDREAFLAAAQALAEQSSALKPVSMPGLPACYSRQLITDHVFQAEDARTALKAAGMTIDRKVNAAIGLAQVLCDEAGRPLLDPWNPDHIRLLLSMPWSATSAVLGAEQSASPSDGGGTPNA